MKGVPQGANCDIFLEIFYIFAKMEKAAQSLTLSNIYVFVNQLCTITYQQSLDQRMYRQGMLTADCHQ